MLVSQLFIQMLVSQKSMSWKSESCLIALRVSEMLWNTLQQLQEVTNAGSTYYDISFPVEQEERQQSNYTAWPSTLTECVTCWHVRGVTSQASSQQHPATSQPHDTSEKDQETSVTPQPPTCISDTISTADNRPQQMHVIMTISPIIMASILSILLAICVPFILVSQ